MSQNDSRDWKFRALTEIWTGDAKGNGDRFIPTGLLGSIRWWFEVLVRGLGGKACDPTSSVRCPDHDKKPTEPGHHCVVCELFGCTAWARKFRLMVLDKQGKVIQTQINVIQTQIKAGMNFTLRFIPLRPICDEEWCLLDMTLRLIADYAAIGGKTVLKPSDEQGRENLPHHRDFGLIQYISGPRDLQRAKTCEQLKSYAIGSRWRRRFDDAAFSWASLVNFWCVKGQYLARQDADTSTFNYVIRRPEPKSFSWHGDSWLAGRKAQRRQRAESKKVFSFKDPQDAQRTFGFVKSKTEKCLDDIRKHLAEAWETNNFLLETSEQLLQKLCGLQGSDHKGGWT